MEDRGHPYARATRLVREHLAALYHSLHFPPAIIFVAIMVAAIFGWQASTLSLKNDLSTAAQSHVGGMERSVHDHLAAYEQILHGGVGLFQSSDGIEAADWTNYLTAFDIQEDHAGVQGIGFVRIFSDDQLPDIQMSLRRQGAPPFTLWPTTTANPAHAAVLYFQPTSQNAQSTIGYDMDSNPVTKNIMAAARDSGFIKITPQVQLMSSAPGKPHIGFNMYAPYYELSQLGNTMDARAAAIRGYVYASFRSDTFFDAILRDTNSSAMGFSVARQTQDGHTQTLYESPTFTDIRKRTDMVPASRHIDLYGQSWIVQFALNPHVLISEIQLRGPESVLFFGTFSAMLISTVVLLLLRARARDLLAQKDQAVEFAKDELLSLASHQLRTPATGVKQYVGMVLQGFAGKVPQSQRELLEKAYASNDRQLRIINEILHLAKIDTGRMILAKQETSLGNLVTDVVNEQRADIDAAAHKLTLDVPTKKIVVRADVHMLRMAIENILSNAIKYTPRGGKLTVRVRQDASRAQVIIKDTGVGIKPADTDTIFHQFSRLPNEMSQQVGGTGIGLYLARHLVELHGGSITVVSQPGQGSTFTVTLPTRVNRPRYSL